MSDPLPKVRFKFHARHHGGRIVLDDTPPGEEAPAPVPRVSRLLALAHKFQRMIDDGTVQSMADIARLGHVTRARVTQIMDLLLLAPDLQETLLFLPAAPGREPIHLKELRYVCRTPVWAEQRERWAEMGVVRPMPMSIQDSKRAGALPD